MVYSTFSRHQNTHRRRGSSRGAHPGELVLVRRNLKIKDRTKSSCSSSWNHSKSCGRCVRRLIWWKTSQRGGEEKHFVASTRTLHRFGSSVLEKIEVEWDDESDAEESEEQHDGQATAEENMPFSRGTTGRAREDKRRGRADRPAGDHASGSKSPATRTARRFH